MTDGPNQAIFVTPALALGGAKLTDIPTKHQVILKDEWKPTEEQTARALKHIQIYLQHPRKGYRSDPKSMDDIREILSHASTYYVQFIGKYPKGRKAIWCNFFTMVPGVFPDWQAREVWLSDGGSGFWQIWFEPDKNEVSGFGANPVAQYQRSPRKSSNRTLELTASRRTTSLFMISTLSPVAARALARSTSALSR